MRFSDSKAWNCFVYKLLYPGILGSMIYDVSEILRGTHFDWFYATKIFIVFLYITDYMHMYFDLQEELNRSNWWSLIIDGLVPISFGVAYWSMTYEDFGRVFFWLAVVMILIFIYPCPEKWRKTTYFFGKMIPLVLSIAAVSVHQWQGFLGGVYVVFTVGVILLTYIIHVFGFTQFARKPKRSKA